VRIDPKRDCSVLSVERPSPQVADHCAIPLYFGERWPLLVTGFSLCQFRPVARKPSLEVPDNASNQSHGVNVSSVPRQGVIVGNAHAASQSPPMALLGEGTFFSCPALQ
jgi:hypothetical protein